MGFCREERVIYDISQSIDVGNLENMVDDTNSTVTPIALKKGHQKFWERKWKFFLKKSFRNLGLRNFCPSLSTLGAKFPPMAGCEIAHSCE